MKNDYLKWSGLCLIGVTILSSCMSEGESPLAIESTAVAIEAQELVTGGENLRTSLPYNYSEKFENQLFQVDYDGKNPLGVAYFPGKGTGMANRMGKALSFINQLAISDPETGNLVTLDAPVTLFFEDELESLQLTDIPDEVSSLTTDGMGNAIWFKNIKNVTTPVSDVMTKFEAQVEVVGGNGRFAGVSGQGVVKGTFNPQNGQGTSVLEARIDF